MRIQRFVVAAALFALAGCEQDPQSLPFDVDDVVTRSIGGQGGTISTPAGAAVQFPTGSLPTTVQVSVSTTQVPTAAARTGAPASPAFKVEPEGTQLRNRADLDLKFSPSTDPSRAWLASVVNVVNGQANAFGNSRVDLATGVVRAKIGTLGTAVVVIPPSSAIYPVGVQALRSEHSAGPASILVTTDSVVSRCGAPDKPCTGLSVSATQNLLDQVEDAALVFPKVDGALRVDGTKASGILSMLTSLRIKLQSGKTAESVEVNAVLEPTAATVVSESANEIRMTAVKHKISGSAEAGSAVQEEVKTLVIKRSGSSWTITIDRTFEIRTLGGALEPARVTLSVPVTIYQ